MRGGIDLPVRRDLPRCGLAGEVRFDFVMFAVERRRAVLRRKTRWNAQGAVTRMRKMEPEPTSTIHSSFMEASR